MNLRRIIRCAVAVVALAVAIAALEADSSAQNLPPPGAYQPIPNFTGVGAGLQFRKAINDRFSGVQPVSPAIASITLANLPAELDGMIVFCKDCKRTTPCAGGGSGAWALGTRGQWSCSSGALESDLSANGNKLTNLAIATTSGDALGYGQSAGGDLGGALPNATVQTVLNGKAPVYSGQVSPQFQIDVRPSFRAAGIPENNGIGNPSCGSNSSTSAVLCTPAAAQAGDVEIATILNGISSAVTYTPPTGWTQISGALVSNSSQQMVEFYHVVGSSEPGTYTFTWSSGSSYAQGQIVAFASVSNSAPVDSVTTANSGSSSVTTLSVGAPTDNSTLDLNVVIGGFDQQPLTLTSPAATQLSLFRGYYAWGSGIWSYASPGQSATIIDPISAHALAAQIALSPALFGSAAPLLNGQPAASLVSPNLSGMTTLASATVTGSIVGSGSSASVSAMNLNGVYNVQNYGAVGDGVTINDDVGEQRAIDAACAATNGPPATVYWPTPSGFYVNDAPLFIHCSNLRLQGPGIASTTQQLIQQDAASGDAGPAFVFQQYAMAGVTLGAPLISGSTHSASFDGSMAYYVNLNDAPNVPKGLNGSSAATIDAYVKLSSTADGVIVASTGRRATYSGQTVAFSLRIIGTHFVGSMTVSGTGYNLTDASTTLATGTLYDEQMTYDGSMIRLFTNGALVASHSVSGTITQPYWEVVTVGAQLADFPDGSSTTSPISGLIDGVQISNVARHTAAFTPCNCEPSNDSNNVVIASFDTNLNMLTRLAFSPNRTVWSYVRRGTNAGVGGIEMDGISFNGRNGSMGIVGQQFNGCHIRHSLFSNVASGIYEFTNDFENTFDDLYISGSYIDFYAGQQSGLQLLTGGINLVGGMVGLRVQDSSIAAVGVVIQQQTSNVWGFSIQGDTGFSYFVCDGCGVDAEGGGTSWLGTLQLDNLEVASWNGGSLSAVGNSPTVEIDGGSNKGSATFTGANFQPTGTSPVAIHVGNSNLPGMATVIGPYKGNTVQWTDSPADVVVTTGAGTTGIISSTTGGLSNVTPGVSACGTGASVAAGGTSNAFVITVGSTNPTTSCAASFGSAANFANAPVCTAQDISQGFALKQSALSTSGITLTAPTGIGDMHGDVINVECIGK
jgi:hypothetical protein